MIRVVRHDVSIYIVVTHFNRPWTNYPDQNLFLYFRFWFRPDTISGVDLVKMWKLESILLFVTLVNGDLYMHNPR